MGMTMENVSTGAATLEMNMDAKVATNMAARMTFWGLRPTRDITEMASCLAMKCLLRAAAMAKPPSKSMIT